MKYILLIAICAAWFIVGCQVAKPISGPQPIIVNPDGVTQDMLLIPPGTAIGDLITETPGIYMNQRLLSNMEFRIINETPPTLY